MKCFGFCLLNYKIWTSNTVKSVSVKTLQLFFLTFLTRLISITRHQGYLPFDKTGDWFYHVVEVLSLLAVGLAMYGIYGPLFPTYDEKHDKFGHFLIPSSFGSLYAAIPCILVAIMYHPALNREWLSDTSWCVSMYLEAVSMLPQIYMFQIQASDQNNGYVEVSIFLID